MIKLLCSPYLWIPLLAALALTDFAPVEETRARVASVNIDPALIHWTPRLIEERFLRPIRQFEDRETIVLIGNSIINGIGALDRGSLNRKLAERFNVINAGLRGEYLTASAALAAVGVDEATRKSTRQNFHVVVAYPLTRFYTYGGYWAVGQAIAPYCRSLNEAIHGCEALREPSPFRRTVMDLENGWMSGMRCALSSKVVLGWMRNGQIACTKVYSEREPTPLFPRESNRQPDHDAARFRRSVGEALSLFELPESRSTQLATLSDRVSRVTRLLETRKVPYQVHVVLLAEAPWAVESLSPELRRRLGASRDAWAQEISAAQPSWNIRLLKAFSDPDYFDESHFSDSGLAKLADQLFGIALPPSAKLE